jgi:hypothetical protein
MIGVFSIDVITRFPIKIILPYFGYQFNSCKFCVGLKFLELAMDYTTKTTMAIDCTIETIAAMDYATDTINGKNHYRKG